MEREEDRQGLPQPKGDLSSEACCYSITYFILREINHSVVIVLHVHENLNHPSNKVDFGCEDVALLPPSSFSITDTCLGKSLNIHISILTCSRSMGLPELENVPIEDWDKYEHVPGSEVCKKAKWVPNGTFQLQATWTRIGIEVRLVVSEDKA